MRLIFYNLFYISKCIFRNYWNLVKELGGIYYIYESDFIKFSKFFRENRKDSEEMMFAKWTTREIFIQFF